MLSAELVSRSLDPQGKKDVLLARLKAAVDAEQAVPAVVAPIEELMVEPVPTLFKPRLTPAPAAEPTVEAAPAEEGLKRKTSGTDGAAPPRGALSSLLRQIHRSTSRSVPCRRRLLLQRTHLLL